MEKLAAVGREVTGRGMNANEKKIFNKELLTLAVPLALQNLLNALVGAVSVLIAQYWGKGDYTNAGWFLSMAVRYVIVISGIFFSLSCL